jgi:hypothetical protein
MRRLSLGARPQHPDSAAASGAAARKRRGTLQINGPGIEAQGGGRWWLSHCSLSRGERESHRQWRLEPRARSKGGLRKDFPITCWWIRSVQLTGPAQLEKENEFLNLISYFSNNIEIGIK